MDTDAKVRLLQTNDDWRERYEDLVKSGLLSDTLFWSDKKASIEATQAYLAMLQQSSKEHGLTSQQRAAAVLRKIRGVTDGSGEVKFRLTTDIIQAIYTNLPKIKQLHGDFVGSKMLSEKDFWTQFCTSKTFGKELGVGEEFTGKEGNIIDRAFEETMADTAEVEYEETIDTAAPLVDRQFDVSRNEGNELYTRERNTNKPITATIKQLNAASSKALQPSSEPPISIEDMTDIPELHTRAVEHVDTPITFATTNNDDRIKKDLQIDVYDAERTLKMQLYGFAEFQEHVLGTKPTSFSFTTITEIDFTGNHLDIIKRFYKNTLQVLRIFWRLPNSPERSSLVPVLMAAIDSLNQRFTAHSWPPEEKQKADMLLSNVLHSVNVAKEKAKGNK